MTPSPLMSQFVGLPGMPKIELISNCMSRTFTDPSPLMSHRLALTVNTAELAPVPTGVVTLILPEVAPAGTVAVIRAGDTTVKPAAAEVLNLTVVAPFRFVPVMVTTVPARPLEGAIPVIVGGLDRVVAETSLEYAESAAAPVASTR